MIALADTTFQLQQATWEGLHADHSDSARCSSQVAVAAGRHMGCINALCDEVGRPFHEVAALYYRELRQLSERAAVIDYLPVLVSKRVRQHYRHRLLAQGESNPAR